MLAAVNDTVNTLIAFVIVTIALSSLLQIAMNSIKNGFSYKWGAYKMFLFGAYRELFADRIDADAMNALEQETREEATRSRENRIHSVADRLRQYHSKLSLLSGTLSNILGDLRQTDARLSVLKTDKAKAEFLQQQLIERMP